MDISTIQNTQKHWNRTMYKRILILSDYLLRLKSFWFILHTGNSRRQNLRFFGHMVGETGSTGDDNV